MFSRNPAFNHPVYQEGQAVAPADWRGIAADQMAASKSGRAAQRRDAGLMTLSGTLGKTSFLLGLCMASGAATFAVIEREMISLALAMPLMWGSLIVAGILGLIIGFKPKTAPYLSPVYALVEGVFLGVISLATEKYLGPKGDGIIFQAISLTLGIAVCSIAVTWTGLLRLSPAFMRMIVVATIGVGLVYLASILLRVFGVGSGVRMIHDASPIGIGFSLFVVALASFNLVMDLQMIQDAVENQSPKEYEWYSGFALLVTLVWLYVEVLRLLSKLRRRD